MCLGAEIKTKEVPNKDSTEPRNTVEFGNHPQTIVRNLPGTVIDGLQVG